ESRLGLAGAACCNTDRQVPLESRGPCRVSRNTRPPDSRRRSARVEPVYFASQALAARHHERSGTGAPRRWACQPACGSDAQGARATLMNEAKIPFQQVVTSEAELRAIVDGKPGERAVLKDRRGLDEQSRAFI